MGLKTLILKWLGEIPPCETCEVLKMELALAHNQNEKLLNSIIQVPEKVSDTSIQMPLMPKHIPWAVKKQELERADRLKAQELREAFTKTETEDLEKELEVS